MELGSSQEAEKSKKVGASCNSPAPSPFESPTAMARGAWMSSSPRSRFTVKQLLALHFQMMVSEQLLPESNSLNKGHRLLVIQPRIKWARKRSASLSSDQLQLQARISLAPGPGSEGSGL